MQANLRMIHSPDIENIEIFSTNSNDFCFLIQAMVGPKDGLGEESFDFTCCSPAWISRQLEQEPALFGRGLIIMNTFSYKDLMRIISSLCDRTLGDTWEDIANTLNRFGDWEFQDYIA